MTKPYLATRTQQTKAWADGKVVILNEYEVEELVIPHDCPPEYRYYAEGKAKTLQAILQELGASLETIRRYCGERAFEQVRTSERQDDEGLSWMNKA